MARIDDDELIPQSSRKSRCASHRFRQTDTFFNIIHARLIHIYRVAQKSKPLPNDQKIVLKHVSEIRFIRQIEVSVKHYYIIGWY